MAQEAQEKIRAAVRALRGKHKKGKDPGEELFDLLEQALVDLNRVADAAEVYHAWRKEHWNG